MRFYLLLSASLMVAHGCSPSKSPEAASASITDADVNTKSTPDEVVRPTPLQTVELLASELAKEHSAATELEWRKRYGGYGINITTLHLQDGLEWLNGRPVIMALELSDVFRKEGQSYFVGFDVYGTHFVLTCDNDVAAEMAEHREPVSACHIIAATLDPEIRVSYERDAELNSESAVMSDGVYPTRVVYGKCLDAKYIAGVDVFDVISDIESRIEESGGSDD